jgi:hypothetical protein
MIGNNDAEMRLLEGCILLGKLDEVFDVMGEKRSSLVNGEFELFPVS